ncbi:MAG: PQQ-dependent sugar dehydrogenase [Acidimicrobiia bacterium]|nr:PQQ-dependent sugar dehydrogenase [Acidimicrobiia bacterium]
MGYGMGPLGRIGSFCCARSTHPTTKRQPMTRPTRLVAIHTVTRQIMTKQIVAWLVVASLWAGACGTEDDGTNVDNTKVVNINNADSLNSTSSPQPTTGNNSSNNSPNSDNPNNNYPNANSSASTNTQNNNPATHEPDLPTQNPSEAPTSNTTENEPLTLTPVISLPDPIVLIPRPGTGNQRGDLYVGTRAGRVWVLSADEDESPEMVLDISDLTETGCENGLLGMAFDPDGHSLYIHYTDLQQDSQIVAFPMIGHRVLKSQGRTVLSVSQPHCNHNGGSMAFGPDGYLWLSMGDGGGSNDQFGHGQNLNSLLGAILRIDPKTSTSTGTNTYAIPADNPFAGTFDPDNPDSGNPDSETRALAEIWAYGARNPWRFSFDRTTGDLWIADVGQNKWEEIHVLWAADNWSSGANLGWPLYEGNERFSGTVMPEDLVFPIHVYDHDQGCSITGGYVYRGSSIAWLTGTYIFGDFCEGRLWGLKVDPADNNLANNDQHFELGVTVPQATLVSFGEDAAGELYVLSFDDTIYRLEPAT